MLDFGGHKVWDLRGITLNVMGIGLRVMLHFGGHKVWDLRGITLN